VVLEYENEGSGPFLVDLSHRPKWDLQAPDLEHLTPWGLKVPEQPGRCRVCNGVVAGRQNKTQAAFWHLGAEVHETPLDASLTEVTDGWGLLALMGPEAFRIMEKISSLDLGSPSEEPPFWIQGPLLHVPCQVVVLGRERDRAALLVACSRGYGSTMAPALLDAGRPWGLRPAGEDAFTQRLEFWSTAQ
jgi:glycine cleavage system aminomethyltransferase T